MTVNLYDLIDAFELQSESFCSYVNKKNGEIIHLVDGEDFSDIEAELEGHLNPDDLIPLPESWEEKELALRKEFCSLIEDKEIQKTLLNAINEKGVFGKFETSIDLCDMTDQWIEFLQDRLEEMAIDFCKTHQLSFTES